MSNSGIKKIFEQFSAEGTLLDGSPTGSGHIHTTWLIRTAEEDTPDYIVQKINHIVFPPVAEMMGNIQKVTGHISAKNKTGTNGKVLEIIRTTTGTSYYTDPEGNHWRMYRKISPGISYDVVPNNKVAFEAGRAFGKFIGDLRDLPANEIYPVIPGFNSMEMRFEQLKKAVKTDPLKRVSEVKKEIGYAFDRIDDMLVISSLEKEGKLPQRITHNDTKLNNVLFDNDDKAVCVIDLDTVMPGLSLYDFGDTIRTAANTAEEDEPDTRKINFSLPVFKAYSEGFLKETISFLNTYETDHLALSAQYMTFIMGIRFLADYILGDVYYTTRYSNHNLDRCRAQFRLMQLMNEKYADTRNIIQQTLEKYRTGNAGKP